MRQTQSSSGVEDGHELLASCSARAHLTSGTASILLRVFLFNIRQAAPHVALLFHPYGAKCGASSGMDQANAQNYCCTYWSRGTRCVSLVFVFFIVIVVNLKGVVVSFKVCRCTGVVSTRSE